jgi:hypothetical protein
MKPSYDYVWTIVEARQPQTANGLQELAIDTKRATG